MGGQMVWHFALAQTASLLSFMMFHQLLLALAAYAGATLMLRHSALIHTFVQQVMQINLVELEINLDLAAIAVKGPVRTAILSSASALILLVALWARAIQDTN